MGKARKAHGVWKMKRYIFFLTIIPLVCVFYLWSPFGRHAVSEAYAENEGQLLVPQRNVAIVTLELEDAGLSFRKAGDIRKLRPLQQDFMELPGVSKVESILSVSRVISENDDIIVAKAIPSEDTQITDQYMEELAGEIKDFPELSPYINEGQGTLLFYVYFANKTTPLDIYQSLIAVREKWHGSMPFDFTGRSPIIAATESLLTKDINLFFPILAVMVVAIFALLRNIKVVVLSLSLILIAIGSSYGFVRFIGIPDSPLLLLVPVFCLGLFSDYLIHYFYHRRYSPNGGGENLRGLLLFPLSVTALSTLIGFLSLCLINGSGHLQVGVLIAAGVVVTWCGVFYWLDYGRYKPAEKPILRNFQRFQGKLFGRIAKYRYLYFIVIAAAAIWGAMELKDLSIEPYPIEQLPDSTAIKKSDKIINGKFSGSVPFFIEIDTGKKYGILEKSTLLTLDGIHRKMEASNVGFSYSILTVLKRMNFYFNGDEESLLTSSEFDDFYDALIEQYLLYFSSSVDPVEYESMLDSSYRVFSIKGLIYYHNYDDLNDFIALLKELQQDFPEDWTLGLHGMARQLEDEQANLRQNWILSFTGGSFLIFVTVLIFYRRLSLALLSLIPAFISMVVSFGFINLAGIRIDVFSIIFVAIITGLVVDYSIHTLVALNHLRKVNSLESGFSEIVGFSGIPIFLSFLTSLLSFSVLFLSSFRGARILGFLLLISLVLSFFLSLYLIPLIILPIRLKKESRNV